MKSNRPPPLTPAQIRAGRALVEMSQEKLATAAAMSLTSVRDYENERRGGALAGQKAIRLTLEKAGVIFIVGSPDAGPGVRLRNELPSVLRRPTRLVRATLVVPVEWHGNEFAVVVSEEVLEDLGRIPGDRALSDMECVALFTEHRDAILTAAVAAIQAHQATPDRRVYVRTTDIPELK